MIFDLGTAKAKTTLLNFNGYVLKERHETAPADVLLMSFNTFDEIDLIAEAAGIKGSRIKKITQLSFDDNCTVFCGIKTIIEGQKNLSVATLHKGRLYDITDRTINIDGDEYGTSDKLKIYNTSYGKTAILIDTDATMGFLWKKITAADFVFCFTLNDSLSCEITKLSIENNIPAVILSPISSVLVRR